MATANAGTEEPMEEPPAMKCGFCNEEVQQLGVHERDTVEGKVLILYCPHCGSVLTAASFAGGPGGWSPPRTP